jgi:hypothetical protein
MSAAQDAHQARQDGTDGPSALETAVVPTVDPHAIVREHWRDRDEAGRRWCVACGGVWRGGATAGGCAARLLALRVSALEEFISRVLKSHLNLEILVCQEFGGDTVDTDAFDAEWSTLRAPRAGEGGGG